MTDATALAGWLARRTRWQSFGLAAAAGAVAALGQAPFDWWFLAISGFAGMAALVALAATPRAAAAQALAGGAAYFGVALHWIIEPFFVDPLRHGWMAPFAIVLLAVGLALFWALAGGLAARIAPPTAPARRIAGFAALLTGAEYLRATILTGFPWAHPGHVLIDTPLLMLAPVMGPHGMTLVVLSVAGALAWALLRIGALAALAPLAVLVAALPFVGMPAAPDPAPEAPVIRVVQPNAPQHLKWRDDMVAMFFERSVELTGAPAQLAGRAPALVIWPETSLPPLLERSVEWRAVISEAAGPVPVILGAQRLEGLTARNSLAVLDEAGDITSIYDKHHLVPFGEYMPFGDLLAGLGIEGLAAALRGGYRPGAGPALLDLGPLGQAFAMICYEAIFPSYIRRVARPDWMVHITNDAWFGEFSGPYQHLALARLRAAEQGIPVIRAANTGISAVIDARGQVRASLPLGQSGALDAALPPALGPTLYARTGDWPTLVVLLATLGLLALRRGHKGH